MTDGQALYLTLVALYLLEGLAWAPRGSLALVARSSARAAPALPHRTLGNARGGAVLGWPFLPEATIFLVPQWPVSLSPDAALGWVAESLDLEERATHTGSLKPFDAISGVRAEGREVLVDGERIVEAASPTLARRVAGALQELRDLPREARAAAIETLIAAQLDVGAARARVAAYYKETAALRVASLALVVIAFAGAPAIALQGGIERTWPLVLGAIYLGAWVVSALWVRAHRRLAPEDRLERWGVALLIALVPVTAMRAADHLARRALHGLHPLAAAAALAPREHLEPLAAHLIRDARWPRLPACPGEDPEALAAEAHWRAALGRRIEALARELGLDPDALAAPPPPSGEREGERPCPRCHAWYGAEAAACEDCGGIPLAS